MNPTLDWLKGAEKHIRLTLDQLRPMLLETQGNIEHTLKDDKTAVTEMDLLVENRLQRALKEYDKSIPFCGEESGVNYDQPTFWLVDPIDGTEPFIRGMPFATNMIALIDGDQPIMGIVYNFVLGDYYLGIKGQGATCNGHPIHVGNRPLERSFASVGSSTDNGRGDGLYDEIRRRVANMVKFAAFGYECSQLASGALDARIAYCGKSSPWDLAAPSVIVQEAGGRIANIGSNSFDYRNTDIVAANPVIFDQLMELVTSIVKRARD